MSKEKFTKDLYEELEARLQKFEQIGDAGIVEKLTRADYILPTVISGLITALFISIIL